MNRHFTEIFIKSICGLTALIPAVAIQAVTIDYSVVSVPEESGLELTKISSNNDQVSLPKVKRSGKHINWFSNRVLCTMPGNDNIAYLSARNNTTNIFLKDLTKQGSSRQRTNRTRVIDFSFSPDGKNLYFSETRGKTTQIFRTDATNGYVCRQITSGANDYSPIEVPKSGQVFFARVENNGCSIWSYNLKDNFLSNYSPGQNPCPVNNENALIVSRQTPAGNAELWKINYDTGAEECLVSAIDKSFTTPMLSPDGRWIVFVGSSLIQQPGTTYPNTDIYVCRADGTDMRQLTHHAADDLSPAWSNDGRYIYFVSQRGDADATANIWRMTFTE